jgi:hypothetical protein
MDNIRKVIESDYSTLIDEPAIRRWLTVDFSQEVGYQKGFKHERCYYRILKSEPIPYIPSIPPVKVKGFKLIEDRENEILWINQIPICAGQRTKWVLKSTGHVIVTYNGNGNLTITLTEGLNTQERDV